jgi:hypothetical protein
LRDGADFTAPRALAGGALRGVATTALRAAVFGVVPFLEGVPFLEAVRILEAVAAFVRFAAARLVRFVMTRRACGFVAFAFLAGLARRRAALAAARGVLRRADLADFDAVFLPLERPPARELVRTAFFVPPAALRLAMPAPFSALTVVAAYLDSSR